MEKTRRAIRRRIEALATPAGEYRVITTRTGQQPVPVDGRCPSTTPASQIPSREGDA